MTNLLRFRRTAMTVVGKVSSHIVESLLVFLICSRLGEVMRATKDVEKSISSMAILPSRVSKAFENGSVVKMRKPREVPAKISNAMLVE